MANLGGGAEAHARFKQYEYRANSSLVLTTDSRPRDTHEPTGEPETLWGRIDPRSFGDRAVQAKPPELEEKLTKSRKKKAAASDPDDLHRRDAKRRRRAAAAQREVSVLSLTDDVVYKPQTKETRAAYEALLSVIQQQFGGQPLDVLGGAADEVLAVLKNDKIKSPDKKKEIEKLLNPISNQMFDQIVSIGKLITDFHDASAGDSAAAPSGDGMDTALDDDIGVAVEFEENEDDEESDFDQVHLVFLFTILFLHMAKACYASVYLQGLHYFSSSGAR
jgi:pre-mRNA-splicing helicase BRR2